MQTAYSINMGRAIAGMLADLRANVVESLVADVAIAFGLGVMTGAKANSCKLPTAGGQTFAGITINQHTEQSYPFSASSGSYAINSVVNVLRRGLIWVVTTEAVTVGNVAYVVSSGADAGKFQNTNGGSAISSTGIYRETVAAAGIALVEINMP